MLLLYSCCHWLPEMSTKSFRMTSHYYMNSKFKLFVYFFFTKRVLSVCHRSPSMNRRWYPTQKKRRHCEEKEKLHRSTVSTKRQKLRRIISGDRRRLFRETRYTATTKRQKLRRKISRNRRRLPSNKVYSFNQTSEKKLHNFNETSEASKNNEQRASKTVPRNNEADLGTR